MASDSKKQDFLHIATDGKSGTMARYGREFTSFSFFCLVTWATEFTQLWEWIASNRSMNLESDKRLCARFAFKFCTSEWAIRIKPGDLSGWVLKTEFIAFGAASGLADSNLDSKLYEMLCSGVIIPGSYVSDGIIEPWKSLSDTRTIRNMAA